MVAYWLWTSWKVGSYFSVFEQVENLEVILLLLVGHGCFLDILLEPFLSVKTCQSKSFLLYAHIFGVAILKCIFWGSNFEGVPMF